jgi:hypothetical protein
MLSFTVCRHQRATMPNGTITPLGMTLGEPKRECDFTIKADFDQKIQFSCSTLRLSSGSYLNVSKYYLCHNSFSSKLFAQ